MPPFRRQSAEPLYPQTLWNRPVARAGAGRLLIVGGHRGNFSLPTVLYELSRAAGVGQATVVLPDVLRPLLAGAPDVAFVPSSSSGSLGRAALGEITELAAGSDVVALAELSNNSETTTLAESIAGSGFRRLLLFGDSLEVLGHLLPGLLTNPRILVVATWPQLLKIAGILKIVIRLDRSDLAGKLKIIEAITGHGPTSYLIIGTELIAASGGEMTVTDTPHATDYPAAVTAVTAAFWAQNATPGLAELTTAAFVLQTALDRREQSVAQLAAALREAIDWV